MGVDDRASTQESFDGTNPSAGEPSPLAIRRGASMMMINHEFSFIFQRTHKYDLQLF